MNILTRKQIEDIRDDPYALGKDLLCETALALYDENEGLSRAYKEANDLLIEAATENESLRTACDDITNKVEVVEAENALLRENHCKDCCCARSWEALGVTKYTGMSIPEHIEALRAVVEAAEEVYEKVEITNWEDCDRPFKRLEDALAALKGLEGK